MENTTNAVNYVAPYIGDGAPSTPVSTGTSISYGGYLYTKPAISYIGVVDDKIKVRLLVKELRKLSKDSIDRKLLRNCLKTVKIILNG